MMKLFYIIFFPVLLVCGCLFGDPSGSVGEPTLLIIKGGRLAALAEEMADEGQTALAQARNREARDCFIAVRDRFPGSWTDYTKLQLAECDFRTQAWQARSVMGGASGSGVAVVPEDSEAVLILKRRLELGKAENTVPRTVVEALLATGANDGVSRTKTSTEVDRLRAENVLLRGQLQSLLGQRAARAGGKNP